MMGKIKAFAAGLLVGLFVAPRSGRASRQLLMDTLAHFLETGQREFEDLEDDLAARRSNGPLDENDWLDDDESAIGGTESGPGA